MLIECKWCGCDLRKTHASQLYRYFSATEARFGILTNGIVYLFFSDIDEPNKMDTRPFFEFDILNFEEHHIRQLKKFTKNSFSLDDILTTASKLKYTNAIKKFLDEQLGAPSDQLVRFLVSQVYDGRITQSVIKKFRNIVADAQKQFINDKVNERLKTALTAGNRPPEEEVAGDEIGEGEEKKKKTEIVTTEEEIEGFNIVKAILREVLDVKRIAMRDRKSYCGILLDDNNRKPICRLHFDTAQKYIGLFSNKKEERVPISDLNDIFKYADRLKATVAEYDN